MAQIRIMHKAAVLETSLSYDDIKKAAAIVPGSLELADDKGNVFFRVAAGTHNHVSEFGICFDKETKISMLIEDNGNVTKEKAEEMFGVVLLRLTKVEKQVVKALKETSADLKDLISFVE